jgi:hypothetical protein
MGSCEYEVRLDGLGPEWNQALSGEIDLTVTGFCSVRTYRSILREMAESSAVEYAQETALAHGG